MKIEVVVSNRKSEFFEGNLKVIDSTSVNTNFENKLGKVLVIKDIDKGKNIAVFRDWSYWHTIPETKEHAVSPADRCPFCAGEYKEVPAIDMGSGPMYTGTLDVLVWGGEVRNYKLEECEDCGNLRFMRDD